MTQHTSFIDSQWLGDVGVHEKNALDYFYTSPFYDPSSNNELFRPHYQCPTDSLIYKTGLEYVLDPQNMEKPHLFIINKQWRSSQRVTELIDGNTH